jgi:hypothetical protein
MKYSKTELLERAQELLAASITLLEAATEGDANTEAYLTNQLKTFASSNHGFLCSNLNFDKVIQKYERNGSDSEEVEVDYTVEDIMDGNF